MQIQLQKGVTLTCIHTNKFKDIALTINFLAPLTEQNATERTLLALMLCDRCMRYDTKVKMNRVMDDLYGASLFARCVGYGRVHALELRRKIINPCYIHKSNNLFNDWLNLINEILFHPLKIEGQFSTDLFLESKRLLEAKIMRKLDDTQTYTVLKAFETAGKDQPLAVSPQGSLACLEKVTIKDLNRQYESMLQKNPIEIMICGDFNENQLIEMIRDKLVFESRENAYEAQYLVKAGQYEKIKETKQQGQSNIASVFATNIAVTDPLYPALKVANGIFGQYPSSFLFQIVREQHSLCYHISSSLVSYDGAMIIVTGIEKENIEKTMNLIDEVLDQCRKGQFDDDLIETTKNMQIHSLKASLDEMNAILTYNLNNRLLNRELSIEENIAQIQKVTKEEILQVFARLQPMSSCIVEGVEEHE